MHAVSGVLAREEIMKRVMQLAMAVALALSFASVQAQEDVVGLDQAPGVGSQPLQHPYGSSWVGEDILGLDQAPAEEAQESMASQQQPMEATQAAAGSASPEPYHAADRDDQDYGDAG
jgi:hypothetical protein